jgi:hypothetical protein
VQYYPALARDSPALWTAMTKPMVDCKVKASDETTTEGGKTITALSVTNIYEVLKDPKGKGSTTPNHQILQFLEEGAIDLVCAATTLTMNRCDTVRTRLGITAGARSECWKAGLTELYAGSLLTSEMKGTSGTPDASSTAATPTATASSSASDGSSASALAPLLTGAAVATVAAALLV